MSMQQQHADYDLLAVFTDETAAEAAKAKLQNAGFTNEEIFKVSPGSKGEFREHGPNTTRSNVFLQTQRMKPSITLILVLAIVLGIIFGGGVFLIELFLFFIIHLLFFTISFDLIVAGIGSLLGIVVGSVAGWQRSTRVRGNIGQDMSKVNTSNRVQPVVNSGKQNAIAIRLPDTSNISRKSRARAILIQNGGKIDRSVGREA